MIELLVEEPILLLFIVSALGYEFNNKFAIFCIFADFYRFNLWFFNF